MRHTKFRAWSGKSGKYLEYPFSVLADGTGIRVTVPVDDGEVESVNAEFYFKDNDDLVVQQYTGIKDKHGVDICEGDIVKGYAAMATIEWDVDQWVTNPTAAGRFSLRLSEDNPNDALEVIGNLYENPELLEARS